jgi:hypothetical protein
VTDVLIYRHDFRKNAEGQITTWHSNAKLLGELLPGIAFGSLQRARICGRKRSKRASSSPCGR